VEVLILGAGFGGLCAAIRLLQAGRRDFLLLERASRLGGTWRDNRYPGAACDIPSHLYSFSFDLNPRWTRTYAGHAEIQAYLEACTERHGLHPHLRTGAEVELAEWDEGAARWRVRTTDGRVFVSRFVIFGLGALKDPRWPDLPGLDQLRGPVTHSARWPDGLSLAGRRVGVVGTGASAVQILPKIAPEVAELHVFQRTPAWVVPRRDRAYRSVEKAALTRVPGLIRVFREALYLAQEARYPLLFRRRGLGARLIEAGMRAHIRRTISDPALVSALTPTYAAGCKRILISSDYYPTFRRSNVHLHTEAIAAVEPEGLRMADGRLQPLDALVCCTGFTVDQPLGALQVRGRGGVDLAQRWGGRPRAYLGVTVPGYPNAFILLGPNTALGHNSVVVMIEAQVEYALEAITRTAARGPVATVEVRPERLDAFIAEVDHAHQGQAWATGCRSWYLNQDGQNFTVWPGSTLSYRWRLRRFDAEAYLEHGR
jgi:cation diffusion facilitator CzcD-associated flavoprotein CzcO